VLTTEEEVIMTTDTTVETPAEIVELKNRLKASWSAGDYGVVAENLQTSAEKFLSRIPIGKGSRVLDVACGTGQVAFPAFKADAHVTGFDIVPDLIEQARHRATQEKKPSALTLAMLKHCLIRTMHLTWWCR